MDRQVDWRSREGTQGDQSGGADQGRPPAFHHERAVIAFGDQVHELDWIFATRAEWEAAPQSADGSWSVRPLAGFVLALKAL
jgi:hypothetical protein